MQHVDFCDPVLCIKPFEVGFEVRGIALWTDTTAAPVWR
jgi:hypothetical protein